MKVMKMLQNDAKLLTGRGQTPLKMLILTRFILEFPSVKGTQTLKRITYGSNRPKSSAQLVV
jgi:hypothetical protein